MSVPSFEDDYHQVSLNSHFLYFIHNFRSNDPISLFFLENASPNNFINRFDNNSTRRYKKNKFLVLMMLVVVRPEAADSL